MFEFSLGIILTVDFVGKYLKMSVFKRTKIVGISPEVQWLGLCLPLVGELKSYMPCSEGGGQIEECLSQFGLL